jgi:hypothetical protein
VFVVVNLFACFVLLLVHLFLFGGSQLASVSLPVGSHLMVDVLLVLLGLRRFARVHLAAVNAIRDPLLLVALALRSWSLVQRTGATLKKSVGFSKLAATQKIGPRAPP